MKKERCSKERQTLTVTDLGVVDRVRLLNQKNQVPLRDNFQKEALGCSEIERNTESTRHRDRETNMETVQKRDRNIATDKKMRQKDRQTDGQTGRWMHVRNLAYFV